MLFANNIVLIDETHDKVNSELEVWRQTLEYKGFRLSNTKTKYLKNKLSYVTHEVDIKVRLNTHVI